ncbi:MAG: response regulator [Spirochaetia bacterium]
MGENNINDLGTILVVDDEKSILDALVREFSFHNFTVYTAGTAGRALAELAQHEIDIILTDYRMPKTDGMQLLRQVKAEYPEVVRLVFSGFLDRNILMRSLTNGWASTFFTKPWDKNTLQQKIARIMRIKKQVTKPGLFRILNSISQLPTFPSRHKKYLECVQAGKGAQRILRVVEKDPAFAVKIMQVANSVFFGEKRITSVAEALDLLDYGCLKDMDVTPQGENEKPLPEEDRVLLRDIFVHSGLMGMYVPFFYRAFFGETEEKYFPSLGIIHDVGRIITLLYLPGQYHTIEVHRRENPFKSYSQHESELGYRDTAYSLIGMYFLDLWNLPYKYLDVIGGRHTQADTDTESGRLCCALDYTDRLLSILRAGSAGAAADLQEFHSHGISPAVLEKAVSAITRDRGELERELDTDSTA